MPKDYIVNQLKDHFLGRATFSRGELLEFYRQFEPDLNESTFRGRIRSLKRNGIVHTISKSEFTLSFKPVFDPEIDNKLKAIFNSVLREFPNLKASIWSTGWITEFMLHIPGRHWTLVEVEKGSIESVFFFLKDQYKEVFLQPKEKQIEWYVAESSQAIIVKALISLAPLRKVRKIHVPALEKVLLDIFVEKTLFKIFQGKELSVIFNNAYSKYQLNFSTLRAYARRRGKEKELIEFLANKTDIPNNLFND